MKNVYITPEMDVVEFEMEDIVTMSIAGDGAYDDKNVMSVLDLFGEMQEN